MSAKDLSANPAAGGESAAALARRKVVGLSALLAGFACIFFVGFAPMAAVHNAAHDTRHGAAFPCH